jgi:hypothetical protein
MQPHMKSLAPAMSHDLSLRASIIVTSYGRNLVSVLPHEALNISWWTEVGQMLRQYNALTGAAHR